MKTLTVKEAQGLGFKTFQYGFRHFLPVSLPRELEHDDSLTNDLYSQLDPNYDNGESGRFTQMIQSSKFPGNPFFIVQGEHDRENGLETWDFFGAVEIK